ncbi:hypothetical protein RND71_019263 [Anisodus tanguticus]|uniref:Uncharacterized protein n=1 Tax=Anisodus tanguticus TaxID=243964 RepID=A0AAE1VE53_9SOLA|nr:hypothetical protein RND71_019263 [Anisodus tanguticus]
MSEGHSSQGNRPRKPEHYHKDVMPGSELWTDGLICAFEFIRGHKKLGPKGLPPNEIVNEIVKRTVRAYRVAEAPAQRTKGDCSPDSTPLVESRVQEISPADGKMERIEGSHWIPIGWARISEIGQNVQADVGWSTQQFDLTVADLSRSLLGARNKEDLSLLVIFLNQEIRRLSRQTLKLVQSVSFRHKYLMWQRVCLKANFKRDKSLRVSHNLAIFGGGGLVLTIITGLFGINIDGIPGAQNTPYAFGLFSLLLAVLGVVLIDVVLLYLGLKKPISEEHVEIRKLELQELVNMFQHEAETHAQVHKHLSRHNLPPTAGDKLTEDTNYDNQDINDHGLLAFNFIGAHLLVNDLSNSSRKSSEAKRYIAKTAGPEGSLRLFLLYYHPKLIRVLDHA